MVYYHAGGSHKKLVNCVHKTMHTVSNIIKLWHWCNNLAIRRDRKTFPTPIHHFHQWHKAGWNQGFMLLVQLLSPSLFWKGIRIEHKLFVIVTVCLSVKEKARTADRQIKGLLKPLIRKWNDVAVVKGRNKNHISVRMLQASYSL